MDHPKTRPTSTPAPAPEDRSKDWGHGSGADRNGTPGTPVATPTRRARNAQDGRRPLATSKKETR